MRADQQRTAAIVLCGFCAFLGLYSPQPLLPLLREVFHLSTTEASLTITVSTAAVALTAPFVGILADRYGRRRTIVLAALAIAFPTALASIAPTYEQILIWRIVQGILTPSISATTVAYIAEEWEIGAGQAMSFYVAGTVFGGFSGRIVCALVADAWSWRGAFFVLGVLNLAGGIAIARWLPKDRKKHAHVSEKSAGRIILDHLANPRLLATYCAGFCVLFTMIAAFTYINFHLAAPPYGWDTKSLGLLFTVYLVGAASTMSSGRAIDHYGHRAALIVALLCALLGILITLIPAVPAILVGLAICCSGAFVAQASANSYIGAATDHGRGIAVGMYVTAYYLGGSCGAAVPGYLWNWGGWASCVALVVCVILGTICLAALFWRGVTRLDTIRTV